MHHYRSMPPRSTPPPDVVRPQRSIFPENQCTLDQTSSSRSPPPSPRAADFLIIGLFAVRLTKRLIEGLEPYSQSDADISWLSTFLAAYASEYALAKISGPRKDEYVAMYQDIVSRMKRQPRYPMRFMQMNPDGSTRRGGREGGRGEERQMTDVERLDMIDFCDAAGEWGSVVPIPAKEADRMIELAGQRRIADLEDRSVMN